MVRPYRRPLPTSTRGATINPETFQTKCVLSLEDSLLLRHCVLPALFTSGPDSDGDGCSDGEEVAGGSDPCDECDALGECLDRDCNGIGKNDTCETDTDDDGHIDDCDNCPNGSDLWSTPGGGQTTHSFADAPIPAGFFGPGSV